MKSDLESGLRRPIRGYLTIIWLSNYQISLWDYRRLQPDYLRFYSIQQKQEQKCDTGKPHLTLRMWNFSLRLCSEYKPIYAMKLLKRTAGVQVALISWFGGEGDEHMIT
jgi:hypothetical protein